jgi:putative DNA primase/helicase
MGMSVEFASVREAVEIQNLGGQELEGYEIKHLSFDDLELPCFIVEDEWFDLGGKRRPGVWFCFETEGRDKSPSVRSVIRICSPLYVDAVTNTDDGMFFGRLLRFRDTLGRWRKWAMPMEMLRGAAEELRGELLAAGVEIEHKNRFRLADYLQWVTPSVRLTAATRTGWAAKGAAFVLHDRILGANDVYF